MRLLVADDDVDTAQTLADLLGLLLAPVDVLIAFDGEGALTIATNSRQPVDAVLLELDMPRMDGVMVAIAMRKVLGPAAPMLIAITGNHRVIPLARSSQAFDHILTKPVKVEQMLALLRTL